ncbi:MAG TPA: M50 family metallopeptidase [Candidatus Bathyarchaeia archaeon]|nr:M50 family metallopeptidase [Candidatus Bathyarchaeia archaeon]
MSEPAPSTQTGAPAAPPRRMPATLNLLIRSEDGESFETREISSPGAYLQLRPQRLPDAQWELAQLPSGVPGTKSYVLKSRKTENYLLLDDEERFLWQQMDGRASMQDIAVAYVMRYGSFDFEKIPQLMNKLLLADLLTLRPMSRLREILERNRRNPAARAMAATLHAIERLNVSSRRWNELFERIHRYGGWLLFTPWAVAGLAALTAVGIRALLLLWNDLGAISSALGHHAIVAIIALKLAFFVTVAMHQLVHALACVHYGRRVKEVGFIIHHLVVPTFYADVTDLFMASRRARVVNALAGPTVHLVLGLLGVIWAQALTPGLLQACVAASAVLQLQSFLICIYPFSFLEMDGYHVLEDAVGMPRLAQESMQFVRAPLWKKVTRGRRFTRQEIVYVSYFMLSLISVLAFVGLNAWLILSAKHA